MSRPANKKYYHFNGGTLNEDTWMSIREVRQNKDYSKLLAFLMKENNKRYEIAKKK
jgi:hypothetical protein